VRLIASFHPIHLHLRAGFNFYTSFSRVRVQGSGFWVLGSGFRVKSKEYTVSGRIRLKRYRCFMRNLKWKAGVADCILCVVGCVLWVASCGLRVVGCGLGEIEGEKMREEG
jgi:hypothetical protein